MTRRTIRYSMSDAPLRETFAPCPNWLGRRREVSSTAKLVYARLLQYRGNKNAGLAWPSYETLASEVGKCRRTAMNAVKELVDHNLVELKRRRNKSNVFQLLRHPWTESAGEKIAPQQLEPVKGSSPHGEADCTSTGEAGCTQREKKKEIKENPPSVVKGRERGQIENDLNTARGQLSELTNELKPRYQNPVNLADDWRINMLQRAESGDTQAVEDTARWTSIKDQLKRVRREL